MVCTDTTVRAGSGLHKHASATRPSSIPGVKGNAPMLPRTNSRVFCAACCFRNSAVSPDASPYRPCARHLVGAYVLALWPYAYDQSHRLRLLLCYVKLTPICTRLFSGNPSPRGCPSPPPGRRPACRLSSGPAAAPAPPGSAARAASTGWAPHMLCAMPILQVSSCIQMRCWHQTQAMQPPQTMRGPPQSLTGVAHVSSGAVQVEGQVLVLDPLPRIIACLAWERQCLHAGERAACSTASYLPVHVYALLLTAVVRCIKEACAHASASEWQHILKCI